MNMLVKEIEGNHFVENLRGKNFFDQKEFEVLVASLEKLNKLWKGKGEINKKLAWLLFSINDGLHGYLAVCDNINDAFGLKDEVFDAWCVINNIIGRCFADM